MLKHTVLLCFLILLLTVLNGCSDRPSSKLYSHNGFSVTLPNSWVFSNDSEDSLFSEREIIFSLGEFSFVAFYIQNKDSNFSDFVDFYLQKTQLGTSQPGTEVHQSNRKAGRYDVVVTTVTSQFIGEQEISILYSVNIPLKSKNIYFMSLISPEDNVSIDNNLEGVIESLNFDI